jgi:predicted helicase
VLWSKKRAPGNIIETFDWRITPWELHVPLIRGLFEQVAMPSKLGPLGLVEVLDRTGAALNRVAPEAFFARFEEGQAVQYFYEPFLEAFDPELRKELGVWYTPPEIVQYMVTRVDTVLRQELGLADGLADPRVYVLDPCCGTGAYLVAVLQRIAATIQEQGGDALLGADLKRAALERVFGFELLPAPFVVAHLQLGLLLQTFGAPFSDNANERAGVYLTNALTGWVPPTGPKQHLLFPELEAERDAAEHVKRDVPILVILGNPPYNGFAGLAVDEERDLTNAYRTTRRAPAPQGQGLNDLYVRFFRMAERRIVEGTGQGIVCYISNYSWLDGLSFTGMRERYMEVFDRSWIDNLHGDRIISEYAPDGRTSETVFAMEGTSPGIKIGTAISLLVAKKKVTVPAPSMILYRDMHEARAAERRAALLASLNKPGLDDCYTQLQPVLGLGLPFKPRMVGLSYLSWPLLPNIFPVSFPGVKTSRDDVVVDIDRARLVQRMEQYFDPALSHEEMRRIAPGAMQSTATFNAETVRDQLRQRGFRPENIVRYCYRPFDVRWLYWESETNLLDRNRAEYYPHVFDGNVWIVSQQKPRRDWSEPQVIRSLGCLDLMDRSASCIPLYLTATAVRPTLFDSGDQGKPQPNLSVEAVAYISHFACLAEDLFYHTLAVLHAPTYRLENAGALRQDWPRVPLPGTAELLRASAALGRQVATLLDTERPVPGVTSGKLRPELQAIGVITRVGGGALNPAAGDLAVTAGWGHAGKGGVTMPGKGRVDPGAYTSDERAAIGSGASALGLTEEQVIACLGATTSNVYLNDTAYWRNIPANVWDYTIGGYQVIKKWLSYREHALLGRALTTDEAREVTHMSRRIAAIVLLSPALDANYKAVKQTTAPWPGVSKNS